jgi:hypothetical protein
MTSIYFDANILDQAYHYASMHTMNKAWRSALDRAYDLLLSLDAIEVELNGKGEIVVAHIPSQREEGVVYQVNGQCECKAAEQGKPCTHRAAKRLLNICRITQMTQPATGVFVSGRYFRVVYNGYELGLAESYAEGCEWLDSWEAQLEEDAAKVAAKAA